MRQATSIFLAVTIVSLTSMANADVIRSGAVIRNDLGNGSGSVITAYTNQSGLQTNYVSGTTDFDAYNPTSVANGGFGSNSWFSQSGASPGFTDFDLGVSEVVTRIATWTFPQSTSNQTGTIDVFVSDDSNFAGATSVGSFAILDNGSGASALGQVFDITDTVGQFVRVSHLTTMGGNIFGGGDIAFATAVPTPEPASASIFWLGLAGLVGLVRRKRS